MGRIIFIIQYRPQKPHVKRIRQKRKLKYCHEPAQEFLNTINLRVPNARIFSGMTNLGSIRKQGEELTFVN